MVHNLGHPNIGSSTLVLPQKKVLGLSQNDTRIYCVDNIKDLLKTIEIKDNCLDSPSNNAINVSNKGKITKQ